MKTTVSVPGGPAYVFGKKNLAYQGNSKASKGSNAPKVSPVTEDVDHEDDIDFADLYHSKIGALHSNNLRDKIGWVNSYNGEFDLSRPGEFDKLAEATIDYYASPAGYSEIKLKIIQYDDDRHFMGDFYHLEDGIKAEELLDKVNDHRKELISKLDDMPDVEEESYDNYDFLQDFCGDGETRSPRRENEPEYDKHAVQVINELNEEEILALRWVTSDGSHVLNNYEAKKSDNGEVTESELYEMTFGKSRSNEFYQKENIERQSELLSNAIKNNPLPKQSVLYRGMKDEAVQDILDNANDMCKEDSSMDPLDAIFKAASSSYKPGETVSYPNFSSTSSDPATAANFAFSRIVLEIKTDQCIPTGAVSAWVGREQEFIVDKNVEFKVRSVQKTKYDVNNKESDYVVIQLEQVE